jgi:hypothetical protein
MAQPPYEGSQPPEYPPSRQPRRDEQTPSYEQPSYEQSQQYRPYDQPPYGNDSQQPYGGSGGQYGGPGGQYGGPGGQYGGPGGQYGGPGGQYGGSGGQYGGPGGQYPPPYGPKKRGNGFAVAGIILAVLFAPLGLIFAIIGLVKSGARDGAGKVLSIIAIVVSLIVAGSITAGTVAIGNSTVADPGCIAAESSSRAAASTMDADDQAISRDQNNPTAEKADIKKFIGHIQAFIAQLNAAKAEATHQSVKDKIGQMSGDLTGLLAGVQAIEKGDLSQASAVDTYGSKLASDGTAIDQLCVPFAGDDSSSS